MKQHVTEAARRDAVNIALGQQRLEGVSPDPQTLADLERFVAGECSIRDVEKRIMERLHHERQIQRV